LKPEDEAKVAGLMKAAIRGDGAACAEFLRLAAVLVRGLARRKLASDRVVSPEDIVQDVLLAIHTKRQTWRPHEPILPWIFTIARYKIVDVYRRNGKRVFLDVDDFEAQLAAPEADEPALPERQVEAALANLSDGQRRVVKSIAIEGRSITETAKALEMKETAVRVAFHRGLAAIASRFGRRT